MVKFNTMNFKPFIQETIQELNFIEATPIQEKVIPLIKKHRSVIGIQRVRLY